MTRAVRSYVVFVGLLSICTVGLMAMKLVPAARRWRNGGTLRTQGTVIRLPNRASSAPLAQVGGQQLPNIAPFAKVTVSSIDADGGDFEAGVADGVVDTREWMSAGQSPGAWIALEWEKPALVDEVDLYDRLSPEDNVSSGVLSFDDGSTLPVGALPKDGSPARIRFRPKPVTWVKFRIESAQGDHAGLEEIMVRGTLSR